ncbi:hypothetical protein ACA910_010669 [Epithemia clementina (nom. ined.)]
MIGIDERPVRTTALRLLARAIRIFLAVLVTFGFCVDRAISFTTTCGFPPSLGFCHSKAIWEHRPLSIEKIRLRFQEQSAHLRPVDVLVLRSILPNYEFSKQLEIDALENEVQNLTTRAVACTRRRQYNRAFNLLKRVTNLIKNEQQFVGRSEACCRAIDDAFTIFTHTILSPQRHASSSIRPTLLAVEAIHVQLSLSGYLMEPFDKVPRMTFVKALQALTRWNEVDSFKGQSEIRSNTRSSWKGGHNTIHYSYLSFRILQRLITGVGVRNSTGQERVFEKDINMVLNTFSNSGQMDVCQRIVALQLRSNRTPPISPAGYSILLKGYGNLGDFERVESVLQHARETSSMQPDIVFLNSLISAYVNCNSMDKAMSVFDQMRRQQQQHFDSYDATNSGEVRLFRQLPPPNQRTYNTILKGLARTKAVSKALDLSEEMKRLKMWDAVSVNTLVQAALASNDFKLAKDLLDANTIEQPLSSRNVLDNRGKERHPNTEAYTQLLDCYAKSGRLSDALAVLRLMRERSVTPNEVTFTCLISAFARHGRVGQAQQILSYMKSIMVPTVITYNSFISALLTQQQNITETSNATMTHRQANSTLLSPSQTIDDDDIKQALVVLRSMMQDGVAPNAVTISTIIDALGRCQQPRVRQARLLMVELRERNLDAASDKRVLTSLLRTYGLGRDIKGVVQTFNQIRLPDLIAVNVFLDACCRSNLGSMALKAFRHFFENNTVAEYQEADRSLIPDLISYSILIPHFLAKSDPQSRAIARELYSSMTKLRAIYPDTGLVDAILRRMISFARSSDLSKAEIVFAITVLRDAERLVWPKGFLDRRKRAVRAVLSERLKAMGRNKDSVEMNKLVRDMGPKDDDNELFRKKGWNQVDSTFRLLGPKQAFVSNSDDADDFLKSKGWNSVDSGFRIL